MLSTEDQNGMDELRNKIVSAILSGDSEAYIDCFEDDGMVLHPGNPPISGRSAIREHIGAMYSAIRVTKLALSPLVIDGSADLAYEVGTQVLQIEPELEGFGSQRKYLHVARTQPDKSWRFTAVMSSDNG